jgi:nucleoside recognition membrane protein YjiH
MRKLLIVSIIGVIIFFVASSFQKKVKSGIDNHYSTVNSLIELEMSK